MVRFTARVWIGARFWAIEKQQMQSAARRASDFTFRFGRLNPLGGFGVHYRFESIFELLEVGLDSCGEQVEIFRVSLLSDALKHKRANHAQRDTQNEETRRLHDPSLYLIGKTSRRGNLKSSMCDLQS